MNPNLISVRETAAILKKRDVDTIYNGVRRNIFPPGVVVKIGRNIRFLSTGQKMSLDCGHS